MARQLEIRIRGDADHADLSEHLTDSLADFTSTHHDVAVDMVHVEPQDHPCPKCNKVSITAETRRRQENDEPVVVTHEACTHCGFVVSTRILYPNRRRTAPLTAPNATKPRTTNSTPYNPGQVKSPEPDEPDPLMAESPLPI